MRKMHGQTTLKFRSLLLEREMSETKSQTKLAEKIETNCRSNMLFVEYCAAYEIMWKNIILPDRP